MLLIEAQLRDDWWATACTTWSSLRISSWLEEIRSDCSRESPAVLETPSAMLPATSRMKSTSAARTARHERKNFIP
jgi:hypothetical protein